MLPRQLALRPLWHFLLVSLIFIHVAHAQHTCVVPSDDQLEKAEYCGDLLQYPIDSALIPQMETLDAQAQSLYTNDKDLWETFRTIKCASQQAGVSMCSNCLAARREYHCARAFPFCTPADPARPMCRSLCKRVARNCVDPANLKCSTYPESNCASSASWTVPLRMLTSWSGTVIISSSVAFLAHLYSLL